MHEDSDVIVCSRYWNLCVSGVVDAEVAEQGENGEEGVTHLKIHIVIF